MIQFEAVLTSDLLMEKRFNPVLGWLRKEMDWIWSVISGPFGIN
jgi:hypothetical protein